MTKLPTLTTTTNLLQQSISFTSTSLQYQNADEYSDIANAHVQKSSQKLLPLVISPEGTKLKDLLVEKISEFREIKERDQTTHSKRRRPSSQGPQKIDFYSVSTDLGNKADEIVELCNKIASYNPTVEPTKFVGDKELGESAPLQGAWRSLFTTAADANFPQKGDQKAPKVQNVVNAKGGTITNIVEFASKQDGTEPVLKKLDVVIKAKPTSSNRVELQFKYAKALLTKLLWFNFSWTLYIPVPPPFIVRSIVFVSRLFKFGKKGAKRVPNGYFDILYLDNDLRIHKTGEDNYFVQARESWDKIKPLLQ
ncbi:plastid lipid-associated PAP/fibrillin family protein [Nitzschia inconspicua]|uniref:Plastid lipid-associated PAP/fibrillin family protein n=1 Tax=Nitzschia inconspicua TaxID=303405 RepID=A0A9K3PL96_9STRA|nr:plastid lipid-associated PAP/fibrillin family protein [Nitzschia inconspicua]